jgi:hypothetical protein
LIYVPDASFSKRETKYRKRRFLMTFDVEKIALIAQKISFAFEDHYADENKRKLFLALFDRYLSPLDPTGSMETYDVIIQLGRKEPAELERMVKEMKDNSLISD